MTPRPRYFRAALAAAAALAAVAAGCSNPFLPKQAPAPSSGGTTTVYVNYQSTEGVLSTMADAVGVRAQGNGAAAYIGAFADSTTQGIGVTFTFDDSVKADRTNAGAVVPEWRREFEADFYRYLCGLATGEYAMTWLTVPDQPDVTGADDAVLHRYYVVTSGDEQVAAGLADLELRHVTTPVDRWVLVRWDDHRYPGYPANPPDPAEFGFSRLRIDSYNRSETTP